MKNKFKIAVIALSATLMFNYVSVIAAEFTVTSNNNLVNIAVKEDEEESVANGSGAGDFTEVNPADLGYTNEEETKSENKKENKDKKNKKASKTKKNSKKAGKKKKKVKAGKKKATKKKDNTAKNGSTGNSAYDKNIAMRNSLKGVKGKVLAVDDVTGSPLVIQQGNKLILSEWQKEVDKYWGIVRDKNGWRVFSPDRGICPDHSGGGGYDRFTEYTKEEEKKVLEYLESSENE